MLRYVGILFVRDKAPLAYVYDGICFSSEYVYFPGCPAWSQVSLCFLRFVYVFWLVELRLSDTLPFFFLCCVLQASNARGRNVILQLNNLYFFKANIV